MTFFDLDPTLRTGHGRHVSPSNQIPPQEPPAAPVEMPPDMPEFPEPSSPELPGMPPDEAPDTTPVELPQDDGFDGPGFVGRTL